MSETFADQLARVKLMASGSPTWGLSPNDIAALQAVLADRERILGEVASVLFLLYSIDIDEEDDAGLLKSCRDRLRKIGEANS